jgi:DNA-binding transcriptional LysR family regulator
MRSPKDAERPVVSVISRHVVEDEIADGKLFEGRMRNFHVRRKFYIAYSKERKHDAFVTNVVDFLLTMRM